MECSIELDHEAKGLTAVDHHKGEHRGISPWFEDAIATQLSIGDVRFGRMNNVRGVLVVGEEELLKGSVAGGVAQGKMEKQAVARQELV